MPSVSLDGWISYGLAWAFAYPECSVQAQAAHLPIHFRDQHVGIKDNKGYSLFDFFQKQLAWKFSMF